MKPSRNPKALYAGPLVIILFLLSAKSSLAETFSIVVLPDTQFYSQDDPGIFDRQTDWIVDPAQAAENIIYVAHLGDIVDSQFCNGGATEWGNASNSMATLDAAPATPYGVLPGNHDYDTISGGPACATTRVNYNNNFGPSRYGAWYGGSQAGAGNNDNNYTLFSSAGGVEFIAINLAYSGNNGAIELTTLAWADNLLKTNPNRLGIVTSHSILSDDRTGGVDCQSTDPHTEYGRLMWDELKDNPNLIMMLSGHCRGEQWITYDAGSGERPGCLGDVHVLMSNYQGYEGRESGYMRIMRFDTAAWTLKVDTFTSEMDMPESQTVINPIDMDDESVSKFDLNYNAFVGQCVDIALAMDRSGSMNALSAVAPNPTKLVALQNAAKMFIAQIALDNRHRLVMEQFNSAPVSWVPPEVPWAPLGNTGAATANNMIDSMTAGGATNIIGGLEAAVDELDVVGPNDRRVVVLFTDGQHNTPPGPPVTDNAALQSALHTEINDVDTAMELYSIGFGTSINNGPLNTVTSNNGGWHVTEVDPLIVAKSFLVVAAHVMGDQTLSDPVFVLKSGETRSHRFGVSRSDTNITISVNWDLFDPSRIQTNVMPPGGGGCSIASGAAVPGTQQTGGTNYRLIRVNLPFSCSGTDVHEGEWEIQMTASEEVRTPERVNVLAFASSRIKLNARVNLSAGRLNIAAFLGGATLRDATFTAYILPPLPETSDSTRLDTLGSDPAGAASIPPLTLIPRTAIAVPLTVTGRTDESIEAKGTFDPRKKGLYQVRVVADLVDGSGQRINREAMSSFYSPKAKSFFDYPWITIFVILAVLLAAYVIIRGRARRKVA